MHSLALVGAAGVPSQVRKVLAGDLVSAGEVDASGLPDTDAVVCAIVEEEEGVFLNAEIEVGEAVAPNVWTMSAQYSKS